MPLLCIKIGRNEPDTYIKTKAISHHLDIVQLLQDDIAHPGSQAIKEYLVLNMAWGSTSKKDKESIRKEINRCWIRSWLSNTPLNDDEQELESTVIEAKCLYEFDLAAFGGITAQQKIVVGESKDSKMAKKSYDISTINDLKIVSFIHIKHLFINKFNGKIIYVELGLE